MSSTPSQVNKKTFSISYTLDVGKGLKPKYNSIKQFDEWGEHMTYV